MLKTALTLLLLAQDPADGFRPHPTAVTWGERVLIADGDGTVRAWTKALTFDPAFTRKLNGDGLLAIVRAGNALWGFDGRRVFTWDDVGARWDVAASKAPPKTCVAYAVVDGKPVGVCGPGVHRFSDGQYWEAPKFVDQISGQGFGMPKAIATHGTTLAIGTGFGEWGGHLWLLDVASGTWGKHYDALGNVAGITWDGDAWVVAWAMSHLEAHTRVRRHGADGKPTKEGLLVQNKYLRAIASDEGLFALEQNDLVRVKADLTFEKVQSIGKVAYGPERNAVGVSSGIAQMLPLGAERFLIVPISGDALVVGAGKVTLLRAPAVDAGKP